MILSIPEYVLIINEFYIHYYTAVVSSNENDFLTVACMLKFM